MNDKRVEEPSEQPSAATPIASDQSIQQAVGGTADNTAARSTEIVDSAHVVADVQALLASGAITTPADVTMLTDAVTCLRSPVDTGELSKHAVNVGKVWAAMKKTPPVPPALEAIHLHFHRLQYQAYVDAALEELGRESRDVMKIAASVLLAQDQAVRFARDKDDSLHQRLQEFLDGYDMRLKTGQGEAPEGSPETPGHEHVTADVRTFLADETPADQADIQMLTDALGYLESPTGNIADITGHLENIGMVTMYMDATPPALDALASRFLRLQYDHYFDVLKEKLRQEPQNTKEILTAIVQLQDRASRAAGGEDGGLLAELKAFLQRYDMRPKAEKAPD